MADLRKEIETALLRCGVYHDDASFMAGVVARAISDHYECKPRGANNRETGESVTLAELAQELDQIQERILAEQEPFEELARCREAVGLLRFRRVTFEEREQVERLNRKGQYLARLLNELHFDRKIRWLARKLQAKVSPEAWDLYREIEDLLEQEKESKEGALADNLNTL